MTPRRLRVLVQDQLSQFPVVALVGLRQVGKTALSQAIAEGRPSTFLDLALPSDQERLTHPDFTNVLQSGELVILDRIDSMPALAGALEPLLRHGEGRYLLVGSAAAAIRASPALTGKIAVVELSPFDLLEVPSGLHPDLWSRGGFPLSLFAATDPESLEWRVAFIDSYLTREIPQLGTRIPPSTLRAFWLMLAQMHGNLLNSAQLSRGLGIDAKTAVRYLDLMVELLLVRRLEPFQADTTKRQVKSPKTYIRDTGILHALLNIPDRAALSNHPAADSSWEGFAIETLIAAAPAGAVPRFFRTVVGAEISLLLDLPGRGRWAIDIRRGPPTRPQKGFFVACRDLHPERCFVLHSGQGRRTIDAGMDVSTDVIGLEEMALLLSFL